MSDNIIFMHLPKCGGSTFHKILERIYLPEEVFTIEVVDHVKLNTDDFIALSQQKKDKIKVLKGHMIFGLHEQFRGSTDYITFMRDPIERIISYYYYVKRRPNHRLVEMGLFNDQTSLYDFVTNVQEGDIHNGQICMISGIKDTEDRMLEKARENIHNNFSFVGTVEKFNESLIILQNMYKWSTPYYSIANKTNSRPQQNSIDKKTLDAIIELNKGDITLYNEVSYRLNEMFKNERNNNTGLRKLMLLSKMNSLIETRKLKRVIPASLKSSLKRIV